MYDRHGRWYEVVARGVDTSYRVAVVRKAGMTAELAPERFAARGTTYVLALSPDARSIALELRDGTGRIVGRATTPLGGGR